MMILENVHQINISTEPKELAKLLDNHATDWWEALMFLTNYGLKVGIVIDYAEVAHEVEKLQGEE